VPTPSISSTALPRSASLARISSLDGLRALSIALVVALHTLQRYSITHHVSLVWYAVFNGETGVFIFFEISGFLITSLLLQEHEKRGSISLRGFYLRRAFRILPPLYLYIGVVVLLGLAGRLVLTRIDIVSALFFFHNIKGTEVMWSLEHLWSISVEEQFYLVWPFLLVYCLRRPGHAGRIAASIIPCGIILISPVLRVLLGRSANPALHQLGVSFFKFDFIMFGCLVALLQHTARFERIYQLASRRWWLAPAVIALCSALTARYQNYFELPIGYTINAIAIAVFLLWTTRNPSSFTGRILNWKPIVQIGVLSYSIYIWQTLFLHHNNWQVFAPLGRFGTMVSTFPGNWLAILIVAGLSYYVVEQPALKARVRIIQAFHLYAVRRRNSSLQ
jgi:peptidoglycan/LPS O-acetylase OafA/YrhL